jgi:catechol 2,3-dioxygenase-like lactoylglutathione lyase family enzyme
MAGVGIDGLDHVQVAAPPRCEREARSFYGELLGLRELEKPAGLRRSGGLWFAAGAQELHVGVAEDFTPAGKAHPGLRVDSDAALDALAGALTTAGAAVDWDDRIPGRRRFFTSDPWGNRIELLAPSAFPRTPANVKGGCEEEGSGVGGVGVRR